MREAVIHCASTRRSVNPALSVGPRIRAPELMVVWRLSGWPALMIGPKGMNYGSSTSSAGKWWACWRIARRFRRLKGHPEIEIVSRDRAFMPTARVKERHRPGKLLTASTCFKISGKPPSSGSWVGSERLSENSPRQGRMMTLVRRQTMALASDATTRRALVPCIKPGMMPALTSASR